MNNPNSIPPVAVVLGADGGIGSAVCRHLAREGFQLALGTRRPAVKTVFAENQCAFTYEATDPTSLEALFQSAVETCGRIDAVAVCVGSLLLKPAARTTLEEWNEVIAINLTAAFLAVKFAAMPMRKTGGSIVLVSSAAALRGLANHEAIAAAKAGVIGLARSAAASYAAKNIRVNCVAPGLTETPMTQHLTANEASRKVSESMHPLGRIGAPDEVASAIAWLLHPQQSWITGQVLGVDGGLASLGVRATR